MNKKNIKDVITNGKLLELKECLKMSIVTGRFLLLYSVKNAGKLEVKNS